MQYLCIKQITAGEVAYHPGEVIPDGVILPGRSGKLIRSGHISELDMEIPEGSRQEKVFTRKEVDAMVADAVAESRKHYEDQIAGLQEYIVELQQQAAGREVGFVEMQSVDTGGRVDILLQGTFGGEDGLFTGIPAEPEEIQQVFSIMQMNAEEGAKAISNVTSENVLILLHAADSRKTIKEAAKKRAGYLSLAAADPEGGAGGEVSAENDAEGADA